MKRLLSIAVLTACAVASAQVFTRWLANDKKRSTTVMEFAGASGAGLPSNTDLCDAATTADLVGSWHCLKGDGGVPSGSEGLTNNGPMATQTWPACPNGTDCSSVVRLNDPSATSYFSRAATTAPTGDFSVCVAFTNDPSISGSATMAKYTGGFNGAYDLESFISGSASRNDFYVFSGAGQGLTTNIQTALGTENMMCMSYSLSSGKGTPYVNATAGTTTSGTITVDGTSRIHAVNAYSTGGLKNLGRYRGALFTEKALSASDMTRLFQSSIAAPLRTSRGDTITFTRSSGTGCNKDDDSGGQLLRTNQPCVTGGGLYVGRTRDNLLLRSDAIANAAWSDVGTPSAVTRAFTSTFGHTALGSLTDNDGAAKEGRSQAVTTSTQVKYTLSCWMRSSTLDTATLQITGTGNSAGNQTCTFTGLTTTPTRKVCTSGSAFGAGLSAVTASILAGDDASDTGVIGIGDCQLQATDFATPYVRTDGTSATRAADSATIAVSLSSGIRNAKATYVTPPVLDASTLHRVLKARVDANNYFEARVTAGAKLSCIWVNGGASSSGDSTDSVVADTANTLECKYDGTNISACVGGVCTNTAVSFTPFTGNATVYLGGSETSGQEIEGVIKSVCLDTQLGRC